jgi:hypothetical protein
MKIGISTVLGVSVIEIDYMETADLITRISAMADSDELAHWGGIITDLGELDDAEETGLFITMDQAKAAMVKLMNMTHHNTLNDDDFLDVWQNDLNLF